MLPDNRLSTITSSSEFIGGRSLNNTNTVDYETGGIDLYDSSQGLLVQEWRASLIGNDVILDVPSNTNITPTTIYSAAGITEISFSFDQSMHPTLALVISGESILYWYDTSVSGYSTTNYGVDVRNPRLSIDDKRPNQISNSDVIFAYIKSNSLYYRQQRDRYTIERLLKSNCSYLKKIGMGTNNRFLFQGTFT
jgi:hypothetical protein